VTLYGGRFLACQGCFRKDFGVISTSFFSLQPSCLTQLSSCPLNRALLMRSLLFLVGPAHSPRKVLCFIQTRPAPLICPPYRLATGAIPSYVKAETSLPRFLPGPIQESHPFPVPKLRGVPEHFFFSIATEVEGQTWPHGREGSEATGPFLLIKGCGLRLYGPAIPGTISRATFFLPLPPSLIHFTVHSFFPFPDRWT